MTRYVFPGESESYRQGRAELFAAEAALRDQIERVAAMRRALPLGKAMPDYVFREGPADLSQGDPAEFRDVRLSELFDAGHDALIVDHLMFRPGVAEPCVMCSMWADGLSAVAPHVRQRASFVLVAKAELATLRRWARERGWDRIRLLSSHDNSFNRDLEMENEDGSQNPGLSVFSRDAAGTVYHRYTVDALLDGKFRGLDLYSPVWQLLDLLPDGRGDWLPSHGYMHREALAGAAS